MYLSFEWIFNSFLFENGWDRRSIELERKEYRRIQIASFERANKHRSDENRAHEHLKFQLTGAISHSKLVTAKKKLKLNRTPLRSRSDINMNEQWRKKTFRKQSLLAYGSRDRISLCINKQAKNKSQNRTTTTRRASRVWEPRRIKSRHETWTRNLGWNWINNYSPLVVFGRLSGGKFSFLIPWGVFIFHPETINKTFHSKIIAPQREKSFFCTTTIVWK